MACGRLALSLPLSTMRTNSRPPVGPVTLAATTGGQSASEPGSHRKVLQKPLNSSSTGAGTSGSLVSMR